MRRLTLLACLACLTLVLLAGCGGNREDNHGGRNAFLLTAPSSSPSP